MRKSRVLREVRSGQVATSAKLNLSDPRVVEICGMAGYSAAWLCNEHVPNDWSMIENAVRAAKIHDMDLIVRVAKGSYSDMIKPFECDATGIMVPHVTSADEAREVVNLCRCHPVGQRPLDGGNVDGCFCRTPLEEYVRYCNEEKFIILQIESPEAVEQVDAIAAVPGYDFLLFGPGDYSHRIGKLGQIFDPEVESARRQVEAAAVKHGKMCMAVGVPVSPSELLSRGYSLTNLASDVVTLSTSLSERLTEFSSRTTASVTSAYQPKP